MNPTTASSGWEVLLISATAHSIYAAGVPAGLVFPGFLGQPSYTIPVYLQFTYTSNTHTNTHKSTNKYTNIQGFLFSQVTRSQLTNLYITPLATVLNRCFTVQLCVFCTAHISDNSIEYLVK